MLEMDQNKDMSYPVKCRKCGTFNSISLGSSGSARDVMIMHSVVGWCENENCGSPLYVERMAFDHIDGELHLHVSDLTREDLEQLRNLLSKPENKNLNADEVAKLTEEEFGAKSRVVKWIKRNEDKIKTALLLLSFLDNTLSLLPRKSQNTTINNFNNTIIIEQTYEREAPPIENFSFEKASSHDHEKFFGRFVKLSSADEEICRWLDNRIPKKPEK